MSRGGARGVAARLLPIALLVVCVGTEGGAAHVRQAHSGCSERWWPQPRQNACATASASNTLAPSPESVARLELAWTYRPGKGVVGQPVVWAAPGMRQALVYAAHAERVHAVELATGRFRWKAKGGAGEPGALDVTQPLAHGDVLLRVSEMGVLRRYVPRSGHIVWQRSARFPERQILADGNWYMVSNGVLLAHDERTGRPRWTRPWGCFHCGVAGSAGRVFVAGDPENPFDGGAGALHALDARTGRTLWRAGTQTAYTYGSFPALADGRVFVRTIGGDPGENRFSIQAFRASDGKRLWDAPVGRSKRFWFTPLAASAELVVYPSEDGRLYALDAKTGALRWTMPGSNDKTPPAIVNGLVWAGSAGGRLVALDARDGRRLWESPVFENGPGSPVIAGRFVVLGTRDGRLLAYRVPA